MPLLTPNTPSNYTTGSRKLNGTDDFIGKEMEDFSNEDVWNQIKSGQYDKALMNAQQQDLKPILRNWLNKYSNVDINDDQILDLVENWYLYFKSIFRPTNPFFAYLRILDALKIKPTYNDLVSINNKYQEGILNDEDIQKVESMNQVLSNPTFYNRQTSVQNYWLDVYAFFSEPNNVKEALENYPSESIKIKNDTFSKSDLERINDNTNTYILRDSLLFDGGNPNNKLREPRDIKKATDEIYKYMNKNNSNKNKKNKPKEYKNQYKLDDFIKDNADSLKDSELKNDLKLWLDEN